MTKPKETPLSAVSMRNVTCARCGAEFGCSLSGDCWCAEETAKLPMPARGEVEGEDCLCRDCLRKAAASAS